MLHFKLILQIGLGIRIYLYPVNLVQVFYVVISCYNLPIRDANKELNCLHSSIIYWVRIFGTFQSQQAVPEFIVSINSFPVCMFRSKRKQIFVVQLMKYYNTSSVSTYILHYSLKISFRNAQVRNTFNDQDTNNIIWTTISAKPR